MPNIDLARYAGGEQAYVKHYLLEKYLAPLVYKVGTAWDSFVYVDGFSGPWQVNAPELADSSFGVAVETLRCAHTGLRDTKGRNVPIQMILVEASSSSNSWKKKPRRYPEQLGKPTPVKSARGFLSTKWIVIVPKDKRS
jgi:hypothetical protein